MDDKSEDSSSSDKSDSEEDQSDTETKSDSEEEQDETETKSDMEEDQDNFETQPKVPRIIPSRKRTQASCNSSENLTSQDFSQVDHQTIKNDYKQRSIRFLRL